MGDTSDIIKAKRLGDILRDRGFTLSAAESMTGGALSNLICSVSGSSDYFVGCIVCYASRAKGLIDISEQDISVHGIYSKEIAYGLAKGAASYFGTEVGVGITGIAQPVDGGGEQGAWIAVFSNGVNTSKRYRCELGTARNDARRQVALGAIELIIDSL